MKKKMEAREWGGEECGIDPTFRSVPFPCRVFLLLPLLLGLESPTGSRKVHPKWITGVSISSCVRLVANEERLLEARDVVQTLPDQRGVADVAACPPILRASGYRMLLCVLPRIAPC